MYVIKRDGTKEPIDISKIRKQTQDAVKGLKSVSFEELELDSNIQFTEGISTENIQNILIQTAVNKIDIDRPDWTFVAARLFYYSLLHKTGKTLKNKKGSAYSHLSTYLEYGEKEGKILLNLKNKFDLDDLNDYIKPERDYQFNYLGLKTLYDRYLLKNKNGEIFELPQHLFMGVSMFLAQNETNIDSIKDEYLKNSIIFKYGKKTEETFKAIRTYWAKRFYNLISSFDVMLATPTLSNARTPRHQCSSCYIGSTPDNIEGIFDSYKEQSLLSKFGGGIGWDWSKIRAQSSDIDGNKGVAGGVIPFLKIENDIAIAVDQLGTRKGAIAVYLEPWHMDIKDFLDLKKNSGEDRRRAHDLFPALWLNDIFMERAQTGEDFTLFDPHEVPELTETFGDEFNQKYLEYEKRNDIRKEVVNAKDLWKQIILQYFETGNPFLCFKDEANRRNQNSHEGIIRSSNLCTEIFQNTDSNKYLIEIEYTDGSKDLFYENDEITTDEGLVKLAKKLSIFDKLNDKQIFYVGKKKIDGKTAVCNLASINLGRVNTKERIKEIMPIVTRMLDNVIDLNFYPNKKTKLTNMASRSIGLGVMGEAEMLASSHIEWGSKEHYLKIDEIMEYVSYFIIKNSSELGVEKGNYPDFKGSNWNKGILPIDTANQYAKKIVDRRYEMDWTDLRKKAMKNMRNGYLMAIAPTSSISILVGTTQAIEPIFKKKWYEENLSGLITNVVPNLNPDTYNYYVSAYDLDQSKLVKAAAIRQKWIDQGQSLNIFVLPEEIDGKKLNDIYMEAWKLGLKSTYYLRSKSPEEKSDEAEDRSFECFSCQ